MPCDKCSEHSIELDCPPGNPRPSDLIDGVIEGLDLPRIETCVRFFGHFKWDYTDLVDHERWLTIQPTLRARVESLYARGYIRYGSW